MGRNILVAVVELHLVGEAGKVTPHRISLGACRSVVLRDAIGSNESFGLRIVQVNEETVAKFAANVRRHAISLLKKER
jgi:hypothetical protein